MPIREEIIGQLHAEMLERFTNLSDEERDIMRANKGTPYERVLRKVIGEEILGGLNTRAENKVVRNRGLATR